MSPCSMAHLLPHCTYDDSHAWRQDAQGSIKKGVVSQTVLLKAVQEWGRCVLHLRLLHHHHTLKLRVHPAGLGVGTYGYVGIVTWSMNIINPAEPQVEQVIEALVNIISLCHYDCVSLKGRVTNGCYGVDLVCVEGRVGLESKW